MSGLFVSFEGVEGAGKSTQIKLLHESLMAKNISPVLTREPGGTTGAEAIRKLLVTGRTDSWSALSECLLMNASRRDHLERVIIPALEADKVVICDRFSDSTRAYQGYAGEVALNHLRHIEQAVVGDHLPDLTLILDLPVKDGLARALLRGGADRFEKKGQAYHEKVRNGFLAIAKAEPDRCVIINAANTVQHIHDKIIAVVTPRLPAHA